MMKPYFLIIAIFTLFLAACGPAAPAASPSPAPITPPTADSLSPATATNPFPSASPLATIATTPTPPPMPPTASATQLPTQALEATPDLVASVVSATQPQVIEKSISPDGSWLAQVIRYECVKVNELEEYAYEQLLLGENSPAADAQVIAEQLQSCGGLGAFGLGIKFWSSDSQYLYYTPEREGQPDGGPCFWAPALVRRNVTTGVEERLELAATSPDAKVLVIRQGDELIFWNLDQGEVGRLPPVVPGASILKVEWSQDGRSLLVLLSENPDCFAPGTSYLTQISYPDLSQELLLESSQPAFTGFTWESAELVNLIDDQGSRWEYNLRTRALVEVK